MFDASDSWGPGAKGDFSRHLIVARADAVLTQLAARGEPAVVLVFGIERFQSLAAALGGHLDDLLHMMEKRLSQAIGGGETLLGRLRDDAFCCVFAGARATVNTRRLVKACEQAFAVGRREVFVQMRIGASSCPRDGTSAGDLLAKAEIALKNARAAECGYMSYAAGMRDSGDDQLQLEAALRRAIGRDELVLHYQPKFSAKTLRLAGAEALIRWQHPNLGLVSPAMFIPLAEEIGYIETVGYWAIREVCRQLVAWGRSMRLTPISVNVSPGQLIRPGFAETVLVLLRQYRVAPGLLEIEVTESSMLRDPAAAVEQLSALRSAGVSIAVDDFGTGFASLSQLRLFPLDRLKIDRSFVQDLDNGGTGAAIVAAVTGMARNLGLKTVGEGVESKTQLTRLRDFGCDEIQGFLLGRPMSADDFSAVLRNGRPITTGQPASVA